MKGQSAIAHSQYCSIAWNSRHGQLFLLTLFHRSVQGYEIWMLNRKILSMLQVYVYCLLICHKLTKVREPFSIYIEGFWTHSNEYKHRTWHHVLKFYIYSISPGCPITVLFRKKLTITKRRKTIYFLWPHHMLCSYAFFTRCLAV